MFFSAPNVRLEGFKVTTDLVGMCWITFIAAVAVCLLTDPCACHGACLPSVHKCLVLVSGCFAAFTACCTTYHLTPCAWEHSDNSSDSVLLTGQTGTPCELKSEGP